MTRDIWVTTENKSDGIIEKPTEKEYYDGDYGARYIATYKVKFNVTHVHGYEICKMCDNEVNDKSIKYDDHLFCSVDCLNKYIDTKKVKQ